MADQDLYGEERTPSGFLLLLLTVALLAAIGALVWSYFLQSRLNAVDVSLNQARQQNAELTTQLATTDRTLRATMEELGAKLGITQRQVEQRAQSILHQQQAATALLAEQEAEMRKQVGSVSSEVSNVKTDVGGVKSDVASTRQDVARTQQELAQTEQRLQRAVGDLGVQSGLIATNAQQLNYLRHVGDRNYYEFKLNKKNEPTAISTIKLQLHKADPRHSRYTLEVFSDDKRIEKKNRELDEPLQFYTGKQPVLYEIVVNSIQKNEVSGYLSTPKNAPQPVTP